jgi:hypothetical protein
VKGALTFLDFNEESDMEIRRFEVGANLDTARSPCRALYFITFEEVRLNVSGALTFIDFNEESDMEI